jgi:nucleoside-diphosphate-sugar epimerase
LKTICVSGSRGFIGTYFVSKYSKKYEIQPFSFTNESLGTLHVKNIDTILHLSALVHQTKKASYEEYERINVRQTIELAKKAKTSGVKQFIFMSTIKVYGEESEIAYKESSTCKPQNDYGRTKLLAEKKLLELEDEKFKISIIRTPLVYGYGVKANVKSLLNLIKKFAILPFGGIFNKRSMVYVGNLCHLADEIITQKQSGIFLASDDEPLSTTKLSNLIAQGLHKKIYLIKIPFFATLLKFLKPSMYRRLYKNLEIDNSYTKAKLGLKNPYSTKEGILLMIDGEEF